MNKLHEALLDSGWQVVARLDASQSVPSLELERLRTALHALRAALAKSDWISVDERLPEHGEAVEVRISATHLSGQWWLSSEDHAITVFAATHWRPVPPESADD